MRVTGEEYGELREALEDRVGALAQAIDRGLVAPESVASELLNIFDLPYSRANGATP